MVGVWVLVATGVAVVAVLVATARRPSGPLPDRDGYLAGWARLHGGYDPSRGLSMVRVWLGVTYRAGRPLAAFGVLPSAVTLLAAWTTGAALVPAAAGGRWPLLAAVVVVLSGLLDNLDGCVAVLTGRASAWGYLLDSLADRVCDGLYLVALWLVGAPAWACVAAGAAVVGLEYARARAGNAGLAEIGVVTVGERPTRVIVTAVGLLLAGLDPRRAGLVCGVFAVVTLAVSAVGLVQLLLVAHRELAPASGSAASGSAGPPAAAEPRPGSAGSGGADEVGDDAGGQGDKR